MATLSTNAAPYERPYLMLRRVWPHVGAIDLEALHREGMRWDGPARKRSKSESQLQSIAVAFPEFRAPLPVTERVKETLAKLVLIDRRRAPEEHEEAREALEKAEALRRGAMRL